MQDERAADADLVRRCVARESRAWDELVQRHVPVLVATVTRVLGAAGDVEDVLQAVYLKLWDDDCRRLRTFEGRSRLSTWLVVLARREALDRVRARRARRETAIGAAADAEFVNPAVPERNGAAAAASSAVEDREELDRLLAAVDSLPPRERLLVRLVWMDGCAYADAARLLAVPENSISPWLLRARGRLREALAARGGGKAYGTPAGGPPTGRSETQ